MRPWPSPECRRGSPRGQTAKTADTDQADVGHDRPSRCVEFAAGISRGPDGLIAESHPTPPASSVRSSIEIGGISFTNRASSLQVERGLGGLVDGFSLGRGIGVFVGGDWIEDGGDRARRRVESRPLRWPGRAGSHGLESCDPALAIDGDAPMSSLRRLWDESRKLQVYLAGTAIIAAWTAFGMLLYDGLWARICRTAWDVWEIYFLRSDYCCR